MRPVHSTVQLQGQYLQLDALSPSCIGCQIWLPALAWMAYHWYCRSISPPIWSFWLSPSLCKAIGSGCWAERRQSTAGELFAPPNYYSPSSREILAVLICDCIVVTHYFHSSHSAGKWKSPKSCFCEFYRSWKCIAQEEVRKNNFSEGKSTTFFHNLFSKYLWGLTLKVRLLYLACEFHKTKSCTER